MKYAIASSRTGTSNRSLSRTPWNLSVAGVANRRARWSSPSASTLTANRRLFSSASCVGSRLLTQTSSRTGCSDTEHTALAVIPAARPSATVVTTVTPVAKCAIACRYATSSRDTTRTSSGGHCRPFAHDADVVRSHQVGHGPAVQVGPGQALLGEGLEAVELARRLLRLHDVRADRLVGAGVVPLVQLVPAAELGAHGVPEQLHHLHPADGVVAVGAPQVLVEVAADLRRLEVL